MADDSSPPVRLMKFVSQEQLDEAKRTRGERVDDGTAQRDRPLYEILKENKDKRDAEFNERFKHRPPKALDEDETEFLDKLEMAAVAAQCMIVHELKEPPPIPIPQEQRSQGRKKPLAHPLGMMIKVMPQTKKAKVNTSSAEKLPGAMEIPDSDIDTAAQYSKSNLVKAINDDDAAGLLKSSRSCDNRGTEFHDVAKPGLVSYSDESEED
ncbi:hypothetical protein Ancab_020409 [Ancistrocladus abbreviatus]